ncbi:ATP-binding protein [Duodenibacillus massiliensis]|uniref:ATP-binding protein n=1 Tax=Duodenibacillus massiliensis TaxID=1852381 RepID=UPI001F385C0B|nr:ATP-binding protein [Duodenibacillus massiliensis]
MLPVRHWAEFLNDATLADSILDRLVKSSHRLEMDGPSMRDKAQYGAIPRIKRD